MRLNLSWRRFDVVDFEVKAKKSDLLDVRLHLFATRPKPVPPVTPAKDEGPVLRAAGHLQSGERAGRIEPDTTTFGFNRRRR